MTECFHAAESKDRLSWWSPPPHRPRNRTEADLPGRSGSKRLSRPSGISSSGIENVMFCLGPAAQPCPSSGTDRSDFPGRPDASASDRLRRDLQSTIPQAWGVVPESLQIHPVSGGSVPVGTGPLYPSESPPGEKG